MSILVPATEDTLDDSSVAQAVAVLAEAARKDQARA